MGESFSDEGRLIGGKLITYILIRRNMCIIWDKLKERDIHSKKDND